MSKALEVIKKGSRQDNNLDRDIKIEDVSMTIIIYVCSTFRARKIDSRDLKLIFG